MALVTNRRGFRWIAQKELYRILTPREAKNMNYAYFQGQEAQALAYYKKLLETEPDVKARNELAALVSKIAKNC